MCLKEGDWYPVLRPLQMEVVLPSPNTPSSLLRLGYNLTFFRR